MPQYIYTLTLTRPAMLTEGPGIDEEQALDGHVHYLNQQLTAGRALLFGRTQTTEPDTLGIVIFEADNDLAAQQFVDADPAVGEGVMSARLRPFAIAGMSRPAG
jgi:uncharacterized protein YciI